MAMRRAALALAGTLVLGPLTPAPAAVATAGNRAPSSVTIEHVASVPFDAGIAQGARLVGDRFFVTTQRSFSVYDVSNPRLPILESTVPLGFKCCNEDVATNGKILLFSETFPDEILHIWDVTSAPPSELARLKIPRQHTVTCILDCRWAYGSEGAIIDLRDPTRPQLAGEWPVKRNPTHDFEEFKPGFLVNSPLRAPWTVEVLDVRRPLHPRLIKETPAAAPGPDKYSWFHQAAWPRDGHDRFLVLGAEGVPGPVMTFDTTEWARSGHFAFVDRFLVDDSTDPNASSHWFDVHPRFHDGGLIAVGWNHHGTRILEVSKTGQIHDLGAFQPPLASAESAYWITDEIVYVVDFYRGLDIISVTRE